MTTDQQLLAELIHMALMKKKSGNRTLCEAWREFDDDTLNEILAQLSVTREATERLPDNALGQDEAQVLIEALGCFVQARGKLLAVNEKLGGYPLIKGLIVSTQANENLIKSTLSAFLDL